MRRLHLVDGTFELFRAHFAKRPPHRAPDGTDAKATLGVVQSLLWLLHEQAEDVTHVAVAFDNPIRSFRNDMFDGYKTDDGVIPEIRAQFDMVEEAMRAIGVVVWSMNQWEADDALATAAVRWANDVDQVRVLTPDKDLGQVVRGRSIVQIDRIRKKEIDEDGVVAARGVPPQAVPDYLALVGDVADGIPGIPGFGEKTAAALLRAFGRIEDIPADAKTWPSSIRGGDRLAPVLASRRDDALLYRKLATLALDVPLAESLDDLRWRGVPRDAFAAWCAKLGTRTIDSIAGRALRTTDQISR